MFFLKKIIFSILVIFFPIIGSAAQPIVVGNLIGQLGNQLFIIAATSSLAWENNATPCFPDFINQNRTKWNLAENYKILFSDLKTKNPLLKHIKYTYQEPCFFYVPIKYKKNMKISGYFQSEKYFIKYKERIIDLFSPNESISSYLQEKYSDIINDPNTVSIHLRSYLKEDPFGSYHITYGMDYYNAAMDLFPENTQFIVFTNDIVDTKIKFKNVTKNIRFIENEHYIHDFYLMSLCKHNIISNSSFSWWAAYLNRNPDKIVVAPPNWFNPITGLDTKDLLPNDWIIIK